MNKRGRHYLDAIQFNASLSSRNKRNTVRAFVDMCVCANVWKRHCFLKALPYESFPNEIVSLIVNLTNMPMWQFQLSLTIDCNSTLQHRNQRTYLSVDEALR